MSVASTSAKITFVQQAGTFQAMITCSWGDVFQYYTMKGGTVNTYFPDFATMADKPVFAFECSSSREGANLTLSSVTWKLDGQPIATTPALSAYFDIIDSTHIRLKGNLALLGSAPASHALSVEAQVSVGQSNATLRASYNIPITEGSADSIVVTIASGSANCFVINSKDPNAAGYSCKLRGRCFQGTQEITSSVYFKWYKMDLSSSNGWVAISGSPAAQIEVVEPDVATWSNYKCEAYDNAACTGTPLGFDVQEVLDYSDELDIDITFNPSDATIEEGNTSRSEVTVTPRVVYRDSGATHAAYTAAGFLIGFFDSAGMPLYENDASEGTTTVASRTAKLAMAQQAGGDIRVIIQTAS